jgi:mannose-1-phosphate guanylyltransferase
MVRQHGNLWAIILAGGDGQRLNTLTVNADGVCVPKQYCSLDGGASLLELSTRRAQRLVPRERIVTIVNASHRRWWDPELLRGGDSRVVVQPGNRGTGLGILLPLLVIARSDPAARVICLPSDHFVEHEDVLIKAMQQATAPESMHPDRLTLLGISPNAADPGFGYLTPHTADGVGLRPLRSFVEKPAPDVAAGLIRAGSVWNSGIFAASLPLLLSFFPPLVPGLLQRLQALVDNWHDSLMPTAELQEFYAHHPVIDWSHDILQQQTGCLQFLPVPSCGWSDVGTPERLAATLLALTERADRVASPTAAARAFSLASAIARQGVCAA